MNQKTILFSALIGFLGSNAMGQSPKPPPQSPAHQLPNQAKIENPFEIDFAGNNELDYMGMEMGMGMDDDMGMGMMGMSEDMGINLSEDEVFGKRMEMAIHRMRHSKTDAEKSQLMVYTEAALRERYARMIKNRQADIERLKASVANLEGDLQRRATAIDRVVKLQMQSAVLAAEGLLDLNTLPQQTAPQENAPKNQGGFF